MNKIITIIGSVIKKSARILSIGIILNLVRLLFAVFFLSQHMAWIRVILSIVICLTFPFIYVISLKINMIPMATDALFKSYENNINGLSDELSTQLVDIHHRVENQRKALPPRAVWLIKKLIGHLLGMDINILFDALPGDDPATQKIALEAKLNETLEEKIHSGSSGRGIFIINCVLLAGTALVGTIIV